LKTPAFAKLTGKNIMGPQESPEKKCCALVDDLHNYYLLSLAVAGYPE